MKDYLVIASDHEYWWSAIVKNMESEDAAIAKACEDEDSRYVSCYCTAEGIDLKKDYIKIR